jgi:hypothetical protein
MFIFLGILAVVVIGMTCVCLYLDAKERTDEFNRNLNEKD